MVTSLYIHVPFCKRKCVYCNFYSDIYEEEVASSYMDALASQIQQLEYNISSIYIGGGTPTALSTCLFEKMLKSLKPLVKNVSEFTVEANPESLDEERVMIMLDSGVNRISIGMQSIDDRKLKKIGRIHNSRKAVESVHLAAKRGFKNVSIDLIFGLWGESAERWKKELEEAAKLPVTHVSCYELTYEKGTPLFFAASNKSITPLEDESVAGMYELAIDMLSLRGFKQYEVSNFALEGCESKHNLNYWDNGQYLGLGPSAFSYIGGVRKKNVSGIKDYIIRAENGNDLTDFSEKLPPLETAKETAAVKIRTKGGIDFEWFTAKTGYDFNKIERNAIAELIEKGLIKYKKDNNVPTGICLKRKGFLFCDTVSSALL
ncbi:MAG: radical SAM family heme chaperone HemW [Candidatus Omnitrophota bacterium]|nr:radical SAM family heme chaperone HemW [Candidatus Omnitrophota bacterium]